MVYAISQNDVEALAAQTAQGIVKLIAVDYNWGPPVGGRYDEDFLKIWAVSQGDSTSGKVYLQGAKNGDWSINIPLAFQKMIPIASQHLNYGLYFLELGSQYQFPTQFVIRFDTNDGKSYYDNNGGCGSNYKLTPYQSRGVSVISSPDALFALSDITPIKLYTKTLPGKLKIPKANPVAETNELAVTKEINMHLPIKTPEIAIPA
jgi:hypothetical protein